ncbi:DUF3658 domain-containing protein [Ruegeria atlantica]|uniref:DUF1835 domain-containing protein n=1 Tax=Ruegeria atlantica TaxID=81569 RepID=A0A0N7LNG8_9RHOB|nr:DUF3658 domain-containing protein [Ruegeria atlantica]CUH42380.1 Protein of unknown function [Ruegeria atlantica]
MSEILHIALGDSAAGSLRAACSDHGMPGSVFCIPEDLSHGPLNNGVSRIAYMQTCFEGYDDWWIDVVDAFVPWDVLISKVRQENVNTLVVWAGETVSEETFLCMACWWLREQTVRLLRPVVQPKHGHYSVAVQTPAELADQYHSASELSNAIRDEKANVFEKLRNDDRTLRHWNNGSIETVQTDFYDCLLLACCSDTWQPAARVVGAAMGSCDGHNAMSDLFFSSRLRHLIEKGTIDVSGTIKRLRDYQVRLSDLT